MRHGQVASVIPSLFVVMVLLCSAPVFVWAQTEIGPRTAGRFLGATPAEETWLDDYVTEAVLSEVMVLLLCALGGGLAVAGLEALDTRRERREEEAARLHGRITNAMQRDRLLKNLDVTPIVHLPLWGVSGATVELRGHVPTAWLRYALLRTAEQEAARSVAVYHIQDRITIASSMHASAA